MADWSLLPKDLLERINTRFETCFETVHFRSVCSSWRSAVPPTSYSSCLGVTSLLPIFNDEPEFRGNRYCTLKKIPVFLLRFQTPFGGDYLLVGMTESKSHKQALLLPLPEFGMTFKNGIVVNTLNSQIIPLGHYYKIIFYATTSRYPTRGETISKRVAFLQLDDRDFAIIASVLGDLMMYRSYDKRWDEISFQLHQDMVSLKGKFYVVDTSGQGQVSVIEPPLMELSEILSVTQSPKSSRDSLVESGDELLLVQRFTPGESCDEHMHTWFRLFRLEEEGQRRWVRVNDLEDRVVFLGIGWNLCYSAKELPGMKRNCVVFAEPKTAFQKILVFDLGTRKTSKATTECRGYMGAFGANHESLVSCGIVMRPESNNQYL